MRFALNEYFEWHPEELHVFHWTTARYKLRSDISLCTVLQHLRKACAPQVLYVNSETIANDGEAFDEMCALITDQHVWAVNIGESHLDAQQCERIIEAVRYSRVAFMFVEANFVGHSVVRILKDIIRDRRRATTDAPWLLGRSDEQDTVIMSCTAMWWAPWSLGRNQRVLSNK
jgi:hypothetical protein